MRLIGLDDVLDIENKAEGSFKKFYWFFFATNNQKNDTNH